jgi:hypothetical protein
MITEATGTGGVTSGSDPSEHAETPASTAVRRSQEDGEDAADMAAPHLVSVNLP